jgi:predicted transposase YdaD
MLGIRLEETRVYQEAREDEARRSHLPNLAIESGLWTY